MPRIPVRVEPYSSPAKQHRHFKCKRDQVLRALGKAAYINGSQFAIMLVSARGDVETYASDALQDRLDDCFIKNGVAEEARQRALANAFENRAASSTLTADDLLDDGPDMPGGATTPPGEDPFLESWPAISGKAEKLPATDDWPPMGKRDEMGDPNRSYENLRATQTGVMPLTTPNLPSHPFAPGSARVAANANQPRHTLVLPNEKARSAFLELRFGQLQQVMCKMIAKEWIKVIEPKKQTRFPYNKGEEGKPAWWPANVRHKEPDHLMKPERHALLLAMLRSEQSRVARLQLATAEVVVQIKSGRVSLLMDIYRVAREEEKLRDHNMDSNTPITVEVSTLDGWDAEAGCTTETAPERDHATSTTHAEASQGRDPMAKLLSAQHKRRRYTTVGDHSPEHAGRALSWMPQTDMYDAQMAAMRGVSGVPPSTSMAQSIPLRPLMPLDIHRAHPMPSPFETPDMANYSPVSTGQPNGRMNLPPVTPNPSATSGQPTAMISSPMMNRAGMLPYSTTENEMHAQGQDLGHRGPHPNDPAMKAFRPAHSAMPNSPEAWNMLHAQTAAHGYRPDAMVPPPVAMPSSNEGENRGGWEFQYQPHPYMPHPTNSTTWPLPETPMHRSAMPNMSMSVGSNDVRFSPSFDTSFTSSTGPLTPGNVSMQMPTMHPQMGLSNGLSMPFQTAEGKPYMVHGNDMPSFQGNNLNGMHGFDV